LSPRRSEDDVGCQGRYFYEGSGLAAQGFAVPRATPLRQSSRARSSVSVELVARCCGSRWLGARRARWRLGEGQFIARLSLGRGCPRRRARPPDGRRHAAGRVAKREADAEVCRLTTQRGPTRRVAGRVSQPEGEGSILPLPPIDPGHDRPKVASDERGSVRDKVALVQFAHRCRPAERVA
jgi:hypothetical protein